VLEVEDSGIGIPAEQQTTIFGAFEQRSGQSPDRYGGTGLGLAICKRLVELMDGEIRLDSEEGRGSCFGVRLRKIRVASVSELSARDSANVDLDAISFTPATLLLVDDIAVNRDLLRGYLSRYAFQLLEAENGRDAVELARQRQPDLVLMDMRMPVMNGYEASRTLKQHDSTRNIPVIALTASAMEQDAREIGDLCDGYLRKPVSQQELVLELGRFLPHSVAEARLLNWIRINGNNWHSCWSSGMGCRPSATCSARPCPSTISRLLRGRCRHWDRTSAIPRWSSGGGSWRTRPSCSTSMASVQHWAV
jgi:two-component system sensor histidine kinase EvgS